MAADATAIRGSRQSSPTHARRIFAHYRSLRVCVRIQGESDTRPRSAGSHRVNNGIEPRNIRFHISKSPVRHWCGGDPVMTAIVDVFSVFLPAGERFFIRSLKRMRRDVKDPQLLEAIEDFSRQEAYHSREHEDYNKAIASLGYDVEAMEAEGAAALAVPKQRLVCLYATCAIEHLTTTFATVILKHPEILADAPAHYRRLWTWHALEEVEHRAVALDVLKAATPDTSAWRRYRDRVSIYIVTLYLIGRAWRRNLARYAETDGQRVGLGFWGRCLKAYFVRPGILRYALPSLLAYLKPGFDPAKTHDPDFVDLWRVRVAADNAMTRPA